jgi:hypothetical protein
MRSEEQNQGRAPFLREQKGNLDFDRSGAYLSRSTAEAKRARKIG